ncbi:MAG: nuclear transport factor 2 family protein [Candidatus Obscuribacterales bacterium]|nr:nuclear transport factor 2 family protein [Candidatus Obscuribacterales bacterium]
MPLNFEDKLEIQELAVRYANAMDDGDLKAWLDTWAEDGVWEGGIGKYEGKKSLSGLLGDLGARIQNKRHVMTNFVIDSAGDLAKQKCYLFVFERENSTELVASAVYEDTLQKIDGRWKFIKRSVKLDPSFGKKL